MKNLTAAELMALAVYKLTLVVVDKTFRPVAYQ